MVESRCRFVKVHLDITSCTISINQGIGVVKNQLVICID